MLSCPEYFTVEVEINRAKNKLAASKFTPAKKKQPTAHYTNSAALRMLSL